MKERYEEAEVMAGTQPKTCVMKNFKAAKRNGIASHIFASTNAAMTVSVERRFGSIKSLLVHVHNESRRRAVAGAIPLTCGMHACMLQVADCD